MVFEIGKCYKHTTGATMKILARVDTVMWGETLIAEANMPGHLTQLIPIGDCESNAVNYEEISEKEFMKNYS